MFNFADPFAGCTSELGAATLDCIPKIFPIIISLAISFAFIAALLLIVYSGIKFMTSGGDEKQVEGARKTLTYAIIGLVVVLASFFIVQLVGRQTGATCIGTFGFGQCGSANPNNVTCRDGYTITCDGHGNCRCIRDGR